MKFKKNSREYMIKPILENSRVTYDKTIHYSICSTKGYVKNVLSP